jgi:hypothetical protein
VDQNCEHVNAKVIVAKVFYNKAAVSGFDALGVGDHGSHTAGIAAGVTGKTAVVQGVSIDDMSGVAPGAWLGNYNVFPNDIPLARNEDILNAVDAAIADGMDVLNLSIGGGYRGNNDLLAIGLDNAVEAGVVVAVAAGNSGPGAGTIESPGRARNIITVGSSTNQHCRTAFTYPAGGGTTVVSRWVTSTPCQALLSTSIPPDGCASVAGSVCSLQSRSDARSARKLQTPKRPVLECS